MDIMAVLCLIFSPVSSVPLSVFQALQHCHQGSEQPSVKGMTRVRVHGPRACRVTGGTIKFVVATCAEQLAGSTVLFEPSESGLPEGLLASPALVQVTRGSGYVLVVNIGTSDVLLFPRRVLGTLVRVHVVRLLTGVTEVRPITFGAYSQGTQAASSTVSEQIALNLTALPESEQVRALLMKDQTCYLNMMVIWDVLVSSLMISQC